jgi:hypothetical protein
MLMPPIWLDLDLDLFKNIRLQEPVRPDESLITDQCSELNTPKGPRDIHPPRAHMMIMVEHDQKNKVHDTATKDARSCRAKHSLHTQLKEHAHASTQREKVERRAIITHEAGERDGERRMKSYKGRIALMEVM